MDLKQTAALAGLKKIPVAFLQNNSDSFKPQILLFPTWSSAAALLFSP